MDPPQVMSEQELNHSLVPIATGTAQKTSSLSKVLGFPLCSPLTQAGWAILLAEEGWGQHKGWLVQGTLHPPRAELLTVPPSEAARRSAARKSDFMNIPPAGASISIIAVYNH